MRGRSHVVGGRRQGFRPSSSPLVQWTHGGARTHDAPQPWRGLRRRALGDCSHGGAGRRQAAAMVGLEAARTWGPQPWWGREAQVEKQAEGRGNGKVGMRLRFIHLRFTVPTPQPILLSRPALQYHRVSCRREHRNFLLCQVSFLLLPHSPLPPTPPLPTTLSTGAAEQRPDQSPLITASASLDHN